MVTRSTTQAGSLVDAIRQRGGLAVELPLLDIQDVTDGGAALREALNRLTADDWLVVLSPNGSVRVVDHLEVGMCHLAAIGSGTAAAFERAGWTVDLLPDEASSEGLASAFTNVAVRGRVVIVQAEGGREILTDILRSRGIDVEVVIAYRNLIPPVGEEMIKTAQMADTVIFASPSAVDRYVAAAGVNPAGAVCIGSVTAASARGAGFDVHVSEASTVDSLVRALTSHQPD